MVQSDERKFAGQVRGSLGGLTGSRRVPVYIVHEVLPHGDVRVITLRLSDKVVDKAYRGRI